MNKYVNIRYLIMLYTILYREVPQTLVTRQKHFYSEGVWNSTKNMSTDLNLNSLEIWNIGMSGNK